MTDEIKNKKSVMLCAEICRACVAACVECMRMCQASTCADKNTLNACMEACHHCIAACQYCATICDEGNLSEIQKATADCIAACDTCVKACQACASTCPDCKDACTYCAQLCSQCSAICQEVSGTSGGDGMDMKNVKRGARNSRTDMQRLQQIHDYSVENGAVCAPPKSISEDGLVYFGEEVKAVKLDNGDVKLAGYLVRFGDAAKTDLTGDYFTPNTDFGNANISDGWFNHRMPVRYNGKQVVYDEQLPDVKLTRDDVGVFAEIVLGARNEYEKMIAELGLAKALSWSSGTAPHLVDRKQVGNAFEITRWKLGLDASLTPTPAEFRNIALPIKSLALEAAATDKSEISGITTTAAKSAKENFDMEGLEEIKALFDAQKSDIVTLVKSEAKTAAKEAVEEVLDGLPEVKAKMNGKIEFGEQPEDRPFKSIWDNLMAVKTARLDGAQRAEDTFPRLKFLRYEMKATGASEGVPMDGGALLEPTITAEIIKPMNETGSFTQYINPLPVGPNSNSGWVNGVDETSRATGSRWGGIRGYRLAESQTITGSKPAFRRIQWELKKYAALVVATDELLADSLQFERIVQEGVGEELNFMVNDDIMNGVGLAGCQGFINSGAFITVTRENANNITGADISGMYNRMNIRGRANGVWYIGNDSQPQLDKLFASGSTAVLFPYASITPDGVKRLYNRPIVTTEYNQTLGTAGDIVFIDPTQYLFWQKGVQGATSIHVYFTTDEFAWRFTYRADGKSSVASALTPYKGSTTTSPFVGLLATS
jgi:HK97 family phage major capsid protein